MKQQSKNQAPKPMLTALSELPLDGAVKSAAYRFLKTDLSRLRSEEDFKRAYHGLMCALQCLAPIHQGYQRSLIEMRKGLDHFADRFKDSDPYDSVVRIEAERRAWNAVVELVTPHVSAQVRDAMIDIWSDYSLGEVYWP